MIQNAPTTELFMRDGKNSPVWQRWFMFLVQDYNLQSGAGTSSQRPTTVPNLGAQYWDATLQKPIYAASLGPPIVWKDAGGTIV